jgi:hypothetical protein
MPDDIDKHALSRICELVGLSPERAEDLPQALGAKAGPRSNGLYGEHLGDEALDTERLWAHVRDVVALSLWTERFARRPRDELVDAVLAASRERVRLESQWLKDVQGKPVETLRDELGELAIARSRVSRNADLEVENAKNDRTDAQDSTSVAAADRRLVSTRLFADRAGKRHRLAMFAALTAGVTNRVLKPMAKDTSQGLMADMRERGATRLADETAEVAHLRAGAVDGADESKAHAAVSQPRGTAVQSDMPSWIRRVRSRPIPYLVAGAAVAVAIIVLLIALPSSRNLKTPAAKSACPAGLTTPDPRDAAAAWAVDSPGPPRRLRPVHVSLKPAAVAVGHEGVWVAERQGVVLIDPRSQQEAFSVIPVTDDPPSPKNGAFSMALSRDRVWVARRDGVLVSIDRSTHTRVGRERRFGENAGTVALAGGRVWVNNYDDDFEGKLTAINPCGGLTRVKAGREANTVYATPGSLWVTNSVDHSVEKIDPESRRKIGTVLGLDDPQDIIAARRQLWVVQYTKHTIQRIDPRHLRKIGRPIPVGLDPAGLTVGAGALWVPSAGNGMLTRIDLGTARSRIGVVSGGETPTDVAAAFGRLWLPNNAGETVTPVQP